MKKFLALLGALGLTATSSMAVVSCGNKEQNKNLDDIKIPNEGVITVTTDQKPGNQPTNTEILNAVNKEVKDLNLVEDEVEIKVEKEKTQADNTYDETYKVTISAKEDSNKFSGSLSFKMKVTVTIDAKYHNSTINGSKIVYLEVIAEASPLNNEEDNVYEESFANAYTQNDLVFEITKKEYDDILKKETKLEYLVNAFGSTYNGELIISINKEETGADTDKEIFAWVGIAEYNKKTGEKTGNIIDFSINKDELQSILTKKTELFDLMLDETNKSTFDDKEIIGVSLERDEEVKASGTYAWAHTKENVHSITKEEYDLIVKGNAKLVTPPTPQKEV